MCVNTVMKAHAPVGQGGIVQGKDGVRVAKPLPNAKEGAQYKVIGQNHLHSESKQTVARQNYRKL
jgi:hypothetical protein